MPRRKTQEEFITEAINIHGNKYDYSNVIYINNETNIKIICKKHGYFFSNPHIHLQGKGCPSCINKTEGILIDWVREQYDNIETQFRLPTLPNKRFDVCLPDRKIIIELDGQQHFQRIGNWKPYDDTIRIDVLKMVYAISYGYKVIRIYQPWVFNDTNNWKERLTRVIEGYGINYIGPSGLYDLHEDLFHSVLGYGKDLSEEKIMEYTLDENTLEWICA